MSSTYLTGTAEYRRQVHQKLLCIQVVLLFVVVSITVLFLYISKIAGQLQAGIEERQQEIHQSVEPIRVVTHKPKVL